MPKLLTTEYVDKVFFLPIDSLGKEGLWVKPLTYTDRQTLTRNAIQQSGQDPVKSGFHALVNVLSHTIIDWKGFFDATGKELPYNKDVLSVLVEHNYTMFSKIEARISDVVNYGEVDNQKN